MYQVNLLQQYVIIIEHHAICRYIQRFENDISEDEAKEKIFDLVNISVVFARHNQLRRNNEVALCNDKNSEVIFIGKEAGKYLYIITCEENSKPITNWWKKEINHETTKKDII